MDLNRLAVFLRVAKHESFSGAARELGVPASTASRAIATLEEELGAQLFQRTTRKVALTSFGRRLLERVGPAVGALEGELADLSNAGQLGLRVTAPVDIASVFVAPGLAAFGDRHPEVTVDLWVTNRMVDLVAEGFDAAVRASAGRIASSSLIGRKLTAMEFRLYASPAYLRRHGTPEGCDLREHRWIERRGWKHPRTLALPERGATLVADDFGCIREMIRCGAGVGFLPGFLAESDIPDRRLVCVLPDVVQRGGTLTLLHSNTKYPSTALTLFKDFLIEWFARRG
jgi:DNA-binding transcriptional LysR family regulator